MLKVCVLEGGRGGGGVPNEPIGVTPTLKLEEWIDRS